MGRLIMKITKSEGVTPTENVLAALCERTFLKLWCYPNPFKADGKELCDLIAIFEDRVFIFFDRESRRFDRPANNVYVTWERWCRNAIHEQIATARGATRYLSTSGNRVFMDPRCQIPLPVEIRPNSRIHKIIVAHGAAEACKDFSPENISGSLGIAYTSGNLPPIPFPFFVDLDKNDPIHLLDSANLDIIFKELDTIYDFTAYIDAKELAIKKLDLLSYCGEEDLLAHFYINFDRRKQNHFIVRGERPNALMLAEGHWDRFSKSDACARRREADRESYLWDRLIQHTCQNALEGTLSTSGDIFAGRSPVHEMAKEPRVSRRVLSAGIRAAILNFPENIEGYVRNLTFLTSYYKDRGYVFLQLRHPISPDDKEDYRAIRRHMLTVACGAAKNKFPHLHKVIGIAIDAPKFHTENSEDFVLLDCATWPTERRQEFERENEGFKFFQTPQLQRREVRTSEFPSAKRKMGRNVQCSCGSRIKYKKCCGKPTGQRAAASRH
jgi:SEC-C motif